MGDSPPLGTGMGSWQTRARFLAEQVFKNKVRLKELLSVRVKRLT